MGLCASSNALPEGRRGGEKTDWWASATTTKVEREGMKPGLRRAGLVVSGGGLVKRVWVISGSGGR